MPDTVKYGISYLTVIGARLSSDSCSAVRRALSGWGENVGRRGTHRRGRWGALSARA